MTAEALKIIRERIGLTQVELSKKIGVVVSTVSKWEQGVHPIPPMAAKLIKTVCALNSRIMANRRSR